GLLELLPDPHLERYLFRAEVRHDQGYARETQVGIYFAHSQQASARGRPVHCYAAMAFNDLVDPSVGQKDLKANPVALRGHYQPPELPQHSPAIVVPNGNRTPFLFPASGEKPWRRLSVAVTPERVKVVCGGAGGEDQCIADVPRTDLLAAFKRSLPNGSEPV